MIHALIIHICLPLLYVTGKPFSPLSDQGRLLNNGLNLVTRDYEKTDPLMRQNETNFNVTIAAPTEYHDYLTEEDEFFDDHEVNGQFYLKYLPHSSLLFLSSNEKKVLNQSDIHLFSNKQQNSPRQQWLVTVLLLSGSLLSLNGPLLSYQGYNPEPMTQRWMV